MRDDYPEDRRRPDRSEIRRYYDDAREWEKNPYARERDDYDRPRRHRSRSGGSGLAMTLGILVIILLVGGIVGATIYAVHHFTNGERIPEKNWSTFRPPEGGCSILMPGIPTREMDTRIANVHLIQYSTKHEEKSIFGLAFMDIAEHQMRPSILDDIAHGSAEGGSGAINGKILVYKGIKMGPYEGREVHIVPRKHSGIGIFRICLVPYPTHHRAYLLMVAGDYIQPDKGDAARFFNSFQVEGATAAPQPQPNPRPEPRPPLPPDPPPLRPPEPIQPRPPEPQPIRPRPPRRPRVEPGLEQGPIVGGSSTEDAAPLPLGLRPRVDDSKEKKIYLADLDKVEVGRSPPGWKYGRKGHLGNNRRRIQADGWTAYKGLSMHPPAGEPSVMRYPIPESQWFVGWAGIDDSAPARCQGGLTFVVLGDDKVLWRSRPVDRSQWFQECRVSVEGVKQLELRVYRSDGSPNVPTFGHAVWLDPYLIPAAE